MFQPPIHVVPRENSGNWDVKREGNDEPLSTHANQASAERAGQEQALVDRVELKVHNRDGSLVRP